MNSELKYNIINPINILYFILYIFRFGPPPINVPYEPDYYPHEPDPYYNAFEPTQDMQWNQVTKYFKYILKGFIYTFNFL